MTYIQPKVFEKKFTCPFCKAISNQEWRCRGFNFAEYIPQQSELRTSKCQHCDKYTVWVEDVMVHPDITTAPIPNPDLPDNVKELYNEAASISSKSPRGAAALLRLAIQILCKELGEKGENINTDIKELVNKGLPELVQKSLDIVRVTGNNAVHPVGKIDVDEPKVVEELFNLINIIAEYMLSLPNRVSGIFKELPATSREQIEKRDGVK